MMKALSLALLIISVGLSQCTDYYAEAQNKASVCNFNQIDLNEPNVYHCFEAGESYVTTAVCVKASGSDPSQYYEKALFYLKNSIPKLSEKGDYLTKAKAYEKIAEVHLGKGDVETAKRYYNLSAEEYVQAKDYSSAERVQQLAAGIGAQPGPGSTGSGVVRHEKEEGMLSYYLVWAASVSILALFLLIAFRKRSRQPSVEVRVKHVEPEVKRAEQPARADDAKKRAKEKLRKKYAKLK